jgi:hypothetical protein
MKKKRKKRQVLSARHVYTKSYAAAKNARRSKIRDLVLKHRRIDIFAEHVVDRCYEDPPGGDKPLWFHIEMLEHQDQHKEGQILAFRGARKSHYCTEVRILFEIVCNPNIRILLAGDAAGQAKMLLRGIKSHFEKNEELIATFGNFASGASKWDENEIIVGMRTAIGLKEPTVHAVGTETTLPSRHYDIIIGDDLCTVDTTSTEGQRNKLKNWFYKTLLPCLEPDGKLWLIGTRWDEEDLHGWLVDEKRGGDYADSTFVLGVLDEETDESVWESQFPTERMHRIRRGNLAAFELQWMCRAGVSMGGIFTPEHFKRYVTLPDEAYKWQGVDLAVSQADRTAFFAHVTLCITKHSKDCFLVAYREMKLTFPKQVNFINDQYEAHPDTVRVGIERNSYQTAMLQMLTYLRPGIPTQGIWTNKDKTVRANQLTTIYGPDKPIYVLRQHERFVRRMCAFPNGPKDLFDAFDLAVTMGLRGVKRRRSSDDVGLI